MSHVNQGSVDSKSAFSYREFYSGQNAFFGVSEGVFLARSPLLLLRDGQAQSDAPPRMSFRRKKKTHLPSLLPSSISDLRP